MSLNDLTEHDATGTGRGHTPASAHLVGLGAATLVTLFVGSCELALVGGASWGLGGAMHLPWLFILALALTLAVPAVLFAAFLARSVYRTERALWLGQEPSLRP